MAWAAMSRQVVRRMTKSFSALRPGVEEGPLTWISICASSRESLRRVSASVPRQRSCAAVIGVLISWTQLDVLPVFPLGGLGVGHRADHRPAGRRIRARSLRS